MVQSTAIADNRQFVAKSPPSAYLGLILLNHGYARVIAASPRRGGDHAETTTLW
jgi:hypothetical protein